ncbi:MAG: hypothetical protein QM783_02905 [Phycisphaerales bacterium]
MRAGVLWPVAREAVSLHAGEDVAHRGEPLERDGACENVPVLSRFCSPATPPLVRVETSDGPARYAVHMADVGKRGSTDLVLGDMYRALTTRYATESEPNAAIVVLARTPVRRAVLELLVHRPTFGPVNMSIAAHSTIFGSPTNSQIQHGTGLAIPLYERFDSLGPADAVIPPRGLAGHGEMTALAAKRLGFSLSEFDVYRVELEYPPMPAAFVLSFPLGHAPK